jgi:Holliday junction resolvase RusA-like endonuclease
VLKRVGRQTIPIQVLTDEGKKFKLETASHLARQHQGSMLYLHKDTPYGIFTVFFFDEIENKGWPKKAATRYKRLDADNRQKLLQDAVATAAGFDDCQFIVTGQKKERGSPSCLIHIWTMTEGPPHGLPL